MNADALSRKAIRSATNKWLTKVIELSKGSAVDLVKERERRNKKK